MSETLVQSHTRWWAENSIVAGAIVIDALATGNRGVFGMGVGTDALLIALGTDIAYTGAVNSFKPESLVMSFGTASLVTQGAMVTEMLINMFR